MDDILKDFSEDALENAMNLNLSTTLVSWVKGISNAEVHHAPDIAWAITDSNFWFLNSTVPMQLAYKSMAKAAAESQKRADTRRVRATWWVSPSAIKNRLGQHLEAHGYTDVGGPPSMAVDLWELKTDGEFPSGLTIKRVETATMLADWVEVIVTGYPTPEFCRKPMTEGILNYGLGAERAMRLYLGYLNNRPVTASLGMLAGGVAGIYCVATLEEARGRGLGREITLAPLLQARNEGYRIGILQSSEMGYGVYSRIGFESIFQYKLFMLPDPQANS